MKKTPVIALLPGGAIGVVVALTAAETPRSAI
jgi:hypothetical protein